MRPGRAAVLVPACLAIAGCLAIGAPEAGRALEPAAGTAVVVGRIRVFTPAGEQFPWGAQTLDAAAVIDAMGLAPPPLSRPLVAVFAVERDERNLAPAPDEHGWFSWTLPPGRYFLYVMDDLHGGPAGEPALVAPPPVVLAALAVRADPGVQYLGELVLEVQADWAAGAERADYDIVQVSVTAAPEEAQRWVARRFPGSPRELAGPLMIADPRIAGLLRDYSRERAEAALRTLGLD